MHKVKAEMDQFIEGLAVLGVHTALQCNPSLMTFSCPSTSSLQVAIIVITRHDSALVHPQDFINPRHACANVKAMA